MTSLWRDRHTDLWRDRHTDDSGFTLVELTVTSTVLLLLMGMVFISMSLIDNLSSGVTSQYQSLDQALPAMTPFHTLVAAEVEPAPPVAGVPTPGFLASYSAGSPPAGFPSGIFPTVGNYGLTFFSNIGTSNDNVESCPSTCSTGTTAGPALIVAVELDASGNQVTNATACTTMFPCSYQMRMYLPETGLTAPGVSSCPGVGTGPNCIYPNTFRLLANVHNVINNPAGNPPTPLFSYTLFDGGGTFGLTTYPAQSITLTGNEVSSQQITGLRALGYPTDTQSLTACAAPSAAYPTLAISCPADAIQSVTVDLQVAAAGTGSNGGQESNLVVYRYAQSPGSTTAPYQYSATAG